MGDVSYCSRRRAEHFSPGVYGGIPSISGRKMTPKSKIRIFTGNVYLKIIFDGECSLKIISTVSVTLKIFSTVTHVHISTVASIN